MRVYNTPREAKEYPQRRPRHLRAGFLAHRAADDQLRRPPRVLQRGDHRPGRPARPVHAGRAASSRSPACRAGPTGRRASASPTTCSATPGPRSRRASTSTWPARRSASRSATTRSRSQSDVRSWADLNGDDVAQDNEIAAIGNNIRFGQPVLTRRPARRHQARVRLGVQRRHPARADARRVGDRGLVSPRHATT